MAQKKNELGQPIGEPVDNWTAREWPPLLGMDGRSCRLEPINQERHGDDLYQAFGSDRDGFNWTYLSVGPFEDMETFGEWVIQCRDSEDPQFHVVIDTETGKAVGVASYLRIDPKNGVIEVGNIHFSPLLQRTTLATECMYLMMRRAFDELGYRRYEWKCDALNAPSRKAALRLGFAFEGIFRQAIMYKGRNRDTAWYAIIDKDWPAIRDGFESWLDPGNFDQEGNQHESLGRFMPAIRSGIRET